MRGRPILIAFFVLATAIWLTGVLSNPRECRQCAVLDPSSLRETGPVLESHPPAPAPAAVAVDPEARRAAEAFLNAPIIAPWEKQREEILRSSAPAAEKAERLLPLLPLLAGEEQQEATRHTINLLSDDHFLAAAGCFTNASAPTNVQSLFMAELLNRPEKVKLPLSLALARNPDHPCAAAAKKLLELYLGEDLGTNWPAWEAAVQAKLPSNP